MNLCCDYAKFLSFLCNIRKYAFKEYSKGISERTSASNIINLKFILSKSRGSRAELIKFCEIERIPLLYYVPKIKKYIFPNELLLSLIFNRVFLIFEKRFYKSIKRGEIFGHIKSFDDIFELISSEENEGELYVKALIRKNYVFGEETEQILKRLEYTKELKRLNNEIEKNLYSIANLELLNEVDENV